jgi:hypothetical protein
MLQRKDAAAQGRKVFFIHGCAAGAWITNLDKPKPNCSRKGAKNAKKKSLCDLCGLA